MDRYNNVVGGDWYENKQTGELVRFLGFFYERADNTPDAYDRAQFARLGGGRGYVHRYQWTAFEPVDVNIIVKPCTDKTTSCIFVNKEDTDKTSV